MILTELPSRIPAIVESVEEHGPQDAIARRKSEVELFAGTVLRLAAKHGLPAPVNAFYYRRIREIEAGYRPEPER